MGWEIGLTRGEGQDRFRRLFQSGENGTSPCDTVHGWLCGRLLQVGRLGLSNGPR